MNPYAHKGTRDGDELVERSMGLLITAVIIGFMSGFAAIRTSAAIKSFEEMFKGFGADLPDSTRFVLAVPHIWYLFAALGLFIAGWIIARQQVRRDELRKMKLAARLFLIAYGLVFAITAYALYLPIFRMGQVV